MSNGPNVSPQDQARLDAMAKTAEKLAEKMNDAAKISKKLGNTVSSTTMQMKYATQAMTQQGAAIKQQIEYYQNMLTVLKPQDAIYQQVSARLDELAAKHAKLAERTQQMNQVTSSAGKALDTFSLGLAKSADQSENAIVQLVSLSAMMDKGGKGFDDMAKEAFRSGKAFEVVGNALQELTMVIMARAWKQTLQLNSAQADFSRSMAAGAQQARVYGQQIADITQRHLRAGVSAKEVGGAMSELSRVFTDFSRTASGVQEEMAETVVLLQRFGVAASDSVAAMQAMNKYMGASGSMAEGMTRQLFSLAQSLRVPPQIVIRDFAQMSNDLAIHGNRMIDVFNRMYSASRQTGLAMQEIIGITSQFDTFEGAANAAGRLNAVLGGNLVNSLRLLKTTDPTERLMILRQAIMSVAGSAQQMDYHMQNAIVNAAGLRDASQLARLLSGEMERGARTTAAQAAEQERLAIIAQKNMSVQEQLAATMARFADHLLPVLQGLQGIANLLDRIPGGGMTLIAVLGGLTIAMKAVSAYMVIVRTQAMAAALGINMMSAAATTAKVALGGIVGVALTLGAALFLPQHSPSLYDGLPQLASRTRELGRSADSASRPMGRLASASNQASFGMSRLGEATSQTVSSMRVGAISNMASGIRNLGSSLDSIHRERVVDFRTTAQVYESVVPRAVSSAQQLKRDDVQKVSDLVNSANQLSVASRQAQTENLSALVGSFNRIATSMGNQVAASAGGYQGPTQISVDMNLDGRTLDKRIVRLVNKAGNNQ
jgi:hypothetical protein